MQLGVTHPCKLLLSIRILSAHQSAYRTQEDNVEGPTPCMLGEGGIDGVYGVMFHKPIKISKPDSGNQYLNVLEHLCAKMQRLLKGQTSKFCGGDRNLKT